MRHALMSVVLLLSSSLAPAQKVNQSAKQAGQLPTELNDVRQLVNMPELARAMIRTEMLDDIAALNDIFGYLAEGKLAEASDVAEKRIGQSAMGKNAMMARGQGPGRFMPEAMRQLAWGMHDTASEFAKVVKEGDRAKTYAALQNITSNCALCHASFRTR